MPQLERLELKGHAGRSGTTIHGGCAILFSLPFIGAGIAIAIIAFTDVPGKNAPEGIIAAVGVIFFAAGMLVFVNGVRSAAVKRRFDRMKGKDPILADYPWNRTHETDNAFSRGFKGLFGAGFLALFLSPFNWWAFLSDESHVIVVLVTGVFDLILLFILGYCGYLMLRGLKYGTSVLRFETFPFVLGGRLQVRFESPRKIESDQGIEVTLRCVQEAYETRGTGDDRRQQIVCYQIYADRQHVKARDAAAGRATRFALSFPLPEGELETQLSARPARYWELEVKSETPGVDFNATFLVPVYRANPH
jgi:hypothetical protein